jgi:general nucleoside transport system permease protein
VIEAQTRWAALIPIVIGAAVILLIAILLVWLAGANPSAAMAGLIEGAFGDTYSAGETLVGAVPLALVALGVTPALRAGVFPVGSEGQLTIGAVVATAVLLAIGNAPAYLLLPVGCIAGAIGGAAWAFLPALLRARYRVNEILSTLLMNYLAAYLTIWLLRTVMSTSEPVATPRSAHLVSAAMLPKLLPETRLHWGIVLVPVAALLLAYWVRSVSGLAYDVFAARPLLAARMGVVEARAVIGTMLVAGAAAGIAGWVQVAGLEGTLYPSVAGGLGFTGVLVALLGGLAPLGIVTAAFVLATLTTGSNGLQMGTGIPASIAIVLQGILLLGAGLLFALRQRRSRERALRADLASAVPAGEPPP